MNRLDEIIFKKISMLEDKILSLEKNIIQKDQKLKSLISRIVSKDEVDESFIKTDVLYNDLSPEQSYKQFMKDEYNFIFIDITSTLKDSSDEFYITEAYQMSLSNIEAKSQELSSKNTPIYVISEKGCQSILAAEKLSSLGFTNVTNISGGHKFWPGHNKVNLKQVA